MSKQMPYLFICNLAILFVGMGAFPLLPLYANDFGANSAWIGIYMALTYLSITFGTILASWLSGRVPRKTTFVLAGWIGVPALFLLGQATSLWHVVVLTGIVWFTGGVGITLISVFTGQNAEKNNRGRWFSLISLTTSLGAILGGLVVGWLVERRGYPIMFAILAMVYAIWPLVGWWKVQDKQGPSVVKSRSIGVTNTRPSKTYRLLLLTTLLSAATISIARLGLSMEMKAENFAPAAITGTNVIGGLATIPVVLGFGTLSDRLGRRFFLSLGYLIAALSGGMLILANQLWHFWLVALFILVARSINGSLAAALATDILTPEALGRDLPLLSTMSWASGVLGFAGTGYMMDTVGPNSLFFTAMLFSISAAGLVGQLRGRCRERPHIHAQSMLSRLLPFSDEMC